MGTVGALLKGTQPAVVGAQRVVARSREHRAGRPRTRDGRDGLEPLVRSLSATGADHAAFAVQQTFQLADELILNSGGSPRRMSLSLLRNLFSAGANISIDADGVISSAGAGGAGSAGTAGANGASVWSGAGMPALSFGAKGDSYVDAANGDV